MENGIASSTADMLSDVGPDFFDGADADPQETAAEAAAETGDATDSDGPGEVAVPEGEEEVAVEDEEAPAEGADAAPVEGEKVAAEAPALPEGVRMTKDRSGKEGYWVEPSAWEGIHASHKLFEEASNLIQAPFNMQEMELREMAYQGQARMYNDFLSGDPTAQRRFIDDFMRVSKEARDAGEIGGDPFVPFVGQLLQALEQGSPDAYAGLRLDNVKATIEDLYNLAAEKGGDQNLFNTAGHLAKAFDLPYKKSAEMQSFFDQKRQGVTRETQLEKENRELRDQLNGKAQTSQQAEFTNWKAQTSTSIISSLKMDAILPLMKDTQAEWEKIQGGKEAFDSLVVDRLFDQVKDTINKDSKFLDNIVALDGQAKRAVSPQARQRIADQIKQAYVNKANLVIRAKRNEFLTFAAKAFKDKSDQTHARRGAAQSQRAPKGASGPVQKSLVPKAESKAGTTFNAGQAAKEAAALIAAM